MAEPAAEQPAAETVDLEAVTDQTIEACGGDFPRNPHRAPAFASFSQASVGKRIINFETSRAKKGRFETGKKQMRP